MKYLREMALAYNVALGSPDPSTQNGAILILEEQPVYTMGSQSPRSFGGNRNVVLSSACNTFPPGVLSKAERLERPIKYQFIEHSERGAIYAAIRDGEGAGVSGSTMVCPWAACAECARCMICCGVKKLVTHKQAYDRSPPHWQESIATAFEMFEEAGVEVVWFDGKVGAPPLLHSGELWSP